jgi:hypothetical protein
MGSVVRNLWSLSRHDIFNVLVELLNKPSSSSIPSIVSQSLAMEVEQRRGVEFEIGSLTARWDIFIAQPDGVLETLTTRGFRVDEGRPIFGGKATWKRTIEVRMAVSGRVEANKSHGRSRQLGLQHEVPVMCQFLGRLVGSDRSSHISYLFRNLISRRLLVRRDA